MLISNSSCIHFELKTEKRNVYIIYFKTIIH